VEQGRKLMSGNPLVVVADLSAVWVWADFYEDNLPLLTRGAKVRVSSPAQPGESHDGEVALIPPAIDPIKRTARVRIDLPNASLKLRPGMYVDAELAVDRGEALAIPVSAVMPTGTRALVFVDRGEGRLEPRPVQLGRLYGDHYEVLGGIAAGERVVASANFLIDAEAKVQGAVQAFQEPVPAK
jgi:Cu(I)/Ag(I) efflux system membrane fusion protein